MSRRVFVSEQELDYFRKTIWNHAAPCPVTGCWNWMKWISKHSGYGGLTLPDRRGKMYAHRLSYLAFNGPLVGDLFVMHKCDNRRCVNPDHLVLGTNADNQHDAVIKWRSFKKLTKENVFTIFKERHSANPPTLRQLGDRFGVTEQAVWYVLKKCKAYRIDLDGVRGRFTNEYSMTEAG